ncbi:hypothetical protein D3C76_630220 [compost metagenome]
MYFGLRRHALQGVKQQRGRWLAMQVHLAQAGSVDATNLPGLLQLLRRECCVLLAQPAYECCERPLGGLLMLAAPGALPIVFQRRLPGVLCIRVDDAPLL